MERPYYRPCFLGEMFKRTQLTFTDPFMRNFKMATFLEKALTIDHGFFGVLRGFQNGQKPLLYNIDHGILRCFLGEMFERNPIEKGKALIQVPVAFCDG